MHLIRPFAAVLVLSLAAVAVAADAPLELKATRAVRGDVVRYVSLPGTVKANRQVTLYSKVPGYLKSLSVDKGDAVQAGQLLGEIEVPELLADLAKQTAELSVAETAHRRINDARAKSPDLITPALFDEAAGRVEIARASLERTQTLLGFSHIAAPFAGIVTARYADPGAFIPAAASGSTAQSAAVVTLMDFATVRVHVAVPEMEAPLVAVGEPVKFSLESLPGKTFEAKISRFGYALDPATKTTLVEADFANASLLLRPGMYATVRVGVDKHSGVITLPTEALVMEKTAAFVFKTVDGRAKKTAIKPGFNDGAHFEVAEGLAENDLVLIAGKTALTDGQLVTPVESR
jgi:membrane fusion protein (multidrug efflux system)